MMLCKRKLYWPLFEIDHFIGCAGEGRGSQAHHRAYKWAFARTTAWIGSVWYAHVPVTLCPSSLPASPLVCYHATDL
jgi:hypothetical protein